MCGVEHVVFCNTDSVFISTEYQRCMFGLPGLSTTYVLHICYVHVHFSTEAYYKAMDLEESDFEVAMLGFVLDIL